MKLTVAWLSAGVSSFIAAYLIKDEIDEFYYIDIDDQHEDSMRFIKDCERLLSKEIKILKSTTYKSVEEACLGGGIIRNARTGYAFCTDYLKKRVRKEQFELLHKGDEITYVWGINNEMSTMQGRGNACHIFYVSSLLQLQNKTRWYIT